MVEANTSEEQVDDKQLENGQVEDKTVDVPENKSTTPEADIKRKRSASPTGSESNEAKRNKTTHDNDDRRGSPETLRRKKNIKSDFSNLEVSDDQDDIRRQVEFYFSDSNLPTDKFLLNLVQGSKNIPVPLKTIHDFKRMRHFQPYSTVVEAVKASTFLTVNDKDEVARKTPLDKKYTMDIYKNKDIQEDHTIPVSIYAKGFGEETGSTQLDIETFFAPYDAKSVRLRREKFGNFKGSVFVEFENEEAQKAFLELEPKPEFVEGSKLEIMSKRAYIDMKNEAIRDGTVRPRSPHRNYNKKHDDKSGGRGGRNDRGGRGGGRGRDNKRRGDRNHSRSPFRNRGRRDRDHSGSRSRSRSGSRDRYGRDRKARRSSYEGDLDDWKVRREHDQKKKANEEALENDIRKREVDIEIHPDTKNGVGKERRGSGAKELKINLEPKKGNKDGEVKEAAHEVSNEVSVGAEA